MKKATVDFFTDLLVFMAFIGMVFTGVLLHRFPFEAGDRTIWGIHRYDWGDLHWVFCLGFMVLVFVHMVLHWNWARQSFGKYLRIGPKALVAGTLVITLVFSMMVPAYLTRELPHRREFRHTYPKTQPLTFRAGRLQYSEAGDAHEE